MLTELFLAGRYLKPKRNAVSLITLSSVLGVTLGVAVLMVVLAVMTGFTDLMKQKLVETQAHFQVRDPWRRVIRDPSEIVETVRAAGGDAAAVIQSPVLVQRGRELDMQLLLFGTGAEELRKHLEFDTALRRGMLSLEKNEAIISTHMAARWGVKVGDKILLHSPKRLTSLVRFKPDGGMEINPDSSAYLPSEFTVTGIYSIGKYDFDRSVLFVGIDDAAELLDLPWGSATSVFGWGPDPFEQKELIKTLREKLGSYRVSTWEDENKQLLSVLAVEKRMMFFLLIFIVLVAAFSITNTLVTSVYQKTRGGDADLRSAGIPDRCDRQRRRDAAGVAGDPFPQRHHALRLAGDRHGTLPERTLLLRRTARAHRARGRRFHHCGVGDSLHAGGAAPGAAGGVARSGKGIAL